ncbi:hypothetical protein M0802_002394 [Mischocyttarus mexicanus]|nr:hypothetical protein M0802_002394 [Mischocyttarus mexicanus]
MHAHFGIDESLEEKGKYVFLAMNIRDHNHETFRAEMRFGPSRWCYRSKRLLAMPSKLMAMAYPLQTLNRITVIDYNM